MISVASFLLLGGGGKTPKCTDRRKQNHVYHLYARASEASDRAIASEIYVFSGLKMYLHTYTINAVVWHYK